MLPREEKRGKEETIKGGENGRQKDVGGRRERRLKTFWGKATGTEYSIV